MAVGATDSCVDVPTSAKTHMSETPHPPIGRQFPSNTVVARVDATEPADFPAAVVSAVADALDCDVEELPPLSSSIDPDTVASISRNYPEPRGRERSLSFYYAGRDVVVDSDGVVRVAPIPSSADGH